jgi:hypothetical protein
MKKVLAVGALAAAAAAGVIASGGGGHGSNAAQAPGHAQQTTRPNPFDDGSRSTPVDMSTDPATPAETPATATPSEGPASSGTTGQMPSVGSCNDGKRTCGDMTDCADAQYHLRQCGMQKLDRDHDGVPCESICGHS